MLPFFGPSTGRDAVGRVVDSFTDPVTYVDPTRARNQFWGTARRRTAARSCSTRARCCDTAALDPYEFVRDAYLQRRRNLIYDGRPPLDKDLDIAPPRDQKTDVDTRDRVAATPPVESLMAASEDHVAQTAAGGGDRAGGPRMHRSSLRTEPAAVEKVYLASPGAAVRVR